MIERTSEELWDRWDELCKNDGYDMDALRAAQKCGEDVKMGDYRYDSLAAKNTSFFEEQMLNFEAEHAVPELTTPMKITISAPTGLGKSAVGLYLAHVLSEAGFRIVLDKTLQENDNLFAVSRDPKKREEVLKVIAEKFHKGNMCIQMGEEYTPRDSYKSKRNFYDLTMWL